MTDNTLPSGRRSRLGYLGYVFGGLVAILPAAAVYYAAEYLHRTEPLAAAIIFYVLMFIGFTALFYMIKVRRIRVEERSRIRK